MPGKILRHHFSSVIHSTTWSLPFASAQFAKAEQSVSASGHSQRGVGIGKQDVKASFKCYYMKAASQHVSFLG